MEPVPSDERLRAVTLFVWGFEFHVHRMCRHLGQPAIGFWWVAREARHGALPHLGIVSYAFHGAGVRILDEHGLVFDGDFAQPGDDGQGRSHLAWVDPCKLERFLRSLLVRNEDLREALALPYLVPLVRAIPEDWMQSLMREARQA